MLNASLGERNLFVASSLTVDKTVAGHKSQVLSYFRKRAAEFLAEVRQKYGERQFRNRSAAVNRALIEEQQRLVILLRQTSEREKWTHAELLPCVYPRARTGGDDDAGENETRYYRRVLRNMAHPRTGEKLHWTRIIDYYHAAQRIWTMAERSSARRTARGVPGHGGCVGC